MSYPNLIVEKKDSGILVITLNHPQNLNALGREISRELAAALAAGEADPEVRVMVIRGAGRAFSSGGDLSEMRESFKGDPGRYMDELTKAVYGGLEALMELNKPVIASVHGFAYGAAFNLVMACDLAIAASDAVFCESFLKLGLIPGGYATTLLPRLVGVKRAAEFCLTTRDIPAEEALRLGLINALAAPAELEAETMKLALRVAKAPPLAVQETKKLLRGHYLRPAAEQSVIERETQIAMARTLDFQEGVNAFFEKRKPMFQGK